MSQIFARILKPTIAYLPLFALSWSVVALISIVAKDPTCRNLTMGNSGAVISWALGLSTKQIVIWLIGFYLVAGCLYAITGKGDRLKVIQDKFFRPIAVPLIFQIAGFFGALIAEGSSDHALLYAAFTSIAVVAVGLALYNAEILFDPSRSSA